MILIWEDLLVLFSFPVPSSIAAHSEINGVAFAFEGNLPTILRFDCLVHEDSAIGEAPGILWLSHS